MPCTVLLSQINNTFVFVMFKPPEVPFDKILSFEVTTELMRVFGIKPCIVKIYLTYATRM